MPLSRLKKYRVQIAQLIGLPLSEAEALLDLLNDRSCWMLGPTEGSWVIRVPPGPQLRGAHVAIYRIVPETLGLQHRHAQREETLVLEGTLRDDTGRTVRAGERMVCQAGTEHGVVALGPDECICAVVTHTEEALRAAG